jgi:hypothetical protein
VAGNTRCRARARRALEGDSGRGRRYAGDGGRARCKHRRPAWAPSAAQAATAPWASRRTDDGKLAQRVRDTPIARGELVALRRGSGRP